MRASVNSLKIDASEIYAYIRNGFFNKKKTPYQGVFQVAPSYVYTVDLNSFVIERSCYFRYVDCYKKRSPN